jgi:hypothetical protein
MSVPRRIIDQLKLTYEGMFDFNGLYRTITSWFYEKGYDMWEYKNIEHVLATGKDIDIELRPWKKTTDYFKNMIWIRLRATNVKDVEIEKEGVVQKINQGKLMIIFDAYLESDYGEYESQWEKKAWMFFLKTIMEKFVFKRYVAQAEKWLVNDTYQLHGIIQKFLNLYRYEKHV